MPKQYKEDGIVFDLIKTYKNKETARKESLRLRSHGFYSRVRHFYGAKGDVVGYGLLKSVKKKSSTVKPTSKKKPAKKTSTKKKTTKKKPVKKKTPAKKPVPKKKEIKIPKEITDYWCNECKGKHRRYNAQGKKIEIFFSHYEHRKDLTSNQIFLEQIKTNWRRDAKKQKQMKEEKSEWTKKNTPLKTSDAVAILKGQYIIYKKFVDGKVYFPKPEIIGIKTKNVHKIRTKQREYAIYEQPLGYFYVRKGYYDKIIKLKKR